MATEQGWGQMEHTRMWDALQLEAVASKITSTAARATAHAASGTAEAEWMTAEAARVTREAARIATSGSWMAQPQWSRYARRLRFESWAARQVVLSGALVLVVPCRSMVMLLLNADKQGK